MIALDPRQTWDVGFEHEAALPPDQRNVLVCRFPTETQYDQLGDLGQRANGETGAARRELLYDAIALLAVSWKGPLVAPKGPEPFDRATGADKLSIDDGWELWATLRLKSRLEEQERKKSLLPSGSAATATSAGNAGVESPAGA